MRALARICLEPTSASVTQPSCGQGPPRISIAFSLVRIRASHLGRIFSILLVSPKAVAASAHGSLVEEAGPLGVCLVRCAGAVAVSGNSHSSAFSVADSFVSLSRGVTGEREI